MARGTLLLAVVFGLAVAAACGTQQLSDTSGDGVDLDSSAAGTCVPGHAGCPCDQEGQTVACGRTVAQYGDYVTCSEGQSVCRGGAWGACVGDNIVTKSLASASIGAGGGLHIQATGVTCGASDSGAPADPCDPNSCPPIVGSTGDVDAAGVVFGDGGVSIAPTHGGGVDGGTGDGAVCTGLQCQVNWCNGSTNGTTITGKVFDPAGNNPLYNAWVYIPVDPTAPLPAFTQGVTCDTCAGAGSFSAISVAQTAYDGTFTLTKAPNGPNVPIIVQMGKWRRKITLTQTINPCAGNAISDGTLRLPRNRFDGDNNQADIPQIAFVSGQADPFQCMLLKAGIDPNEFGSVTTNSNRRIHYYNSPSNPSSSLDPSFGDVVLADTLWNSASNLAAYDVVILACEGGEYTVKKSTYGYGNLVNYAGIGGRVFLSHFSYVWMKYNTPWIGVPAGWGGTGSNGTQDPLPSTIVTAGFPKGQAFAQWMNIIDPTTNGTIQINQARQDSTSPLAAGVQSWMTATDTAAGALNPATFSPSFTYNAPLTAPAASQCGRVVFSDFHVTTAALLTGGACSKNSDCGYGSTCVVSVPGTCTSGPCWPSTVAKDCGDSKYTCAGAVGGNCGCTSNGDCAAIGAGTCTGNVTGTCASATCYVNMDCAVAGTGVCNGGSYGTCTMKTGKSCTVANQANDCESHVCNAGTCQQTSCTSTGGCGGKESCTGRGKGYCGCTSSTQCSSNGWGTTCDNVTPGTCSGNTCFSNTDCTTGTKVCNGTPQQGTCAANSCATNNDCTFEYCNNGKCSGCYNYNDCPGASTCTGAINNNYCTGTQTNFPYACAQGKLTDQEAALEFELFDLSACVSPNGAPPPPPPAPVTTYNPVTFTLDFTASCPSGTHVVWRELDWQASIPGTSSIAFSAQTADPTADGGLPDYTSVQKVPVYTATTSTALPAWDGALLDVGSADGGASGSGVFNKANPPVASRGDLRVTVTLNPTSDKMNTPTLIAWQVKSDCAPSE
jgi:hypothetical protein